VIYRDPSKRVSYGIWEVSPGKFRVDYGPMTEMTHCLAGAVTLTDMATGAETHVEVGSRVIVPIGSVVVWQVHETYRCVYSAYEEEWDPNRIY
jgi:uncharacterized cupin superfamily protein